jgi:hypothetical protein
MVDRRACVAQSAQQTIGKHLVVFGNENSHGCLLVVDAGLPGLRPGDCLDFSVCFNAAGHSSGD